MADSSMPSRTAHQLEQRFDGPIPAHLATPAHAAQIAERGALAMLERMLAEYLDEAERQERRLAELTESAIADDGERDSELEIARARYAANVRSAGWAMTAVAAQRKKMGLPPHPISAAALSAQAAE